MGAREPLCVIDHRYEASRRAPYYEDGGPYARPRLHSLDHDRGRSRRSLPRVDSPAR